MCICAVITVGLLFPSPQWHVKHLRLKKILSVSVSDSKHAMASSESPWLCVLQELAISVCCARKSASVRANFFIDLPILGDNTTSK